MTLDYKDIPIFYTDTGTGAVLVLLHGFLEDASMWNNLKAKLVETHRVITVDLLGHGKTLCSSDIHTMEAMANGVHAVLSHLNIKSSLFIGHSMGGYVSLAYAEKYPEETEGICLMNSTYEADNDDRKELRAKANKMIADNFESMVRISFSNLFSNKSKIIYQKEFNAALNTALQTPIRQFIAAI